LNVELTARGIDVDADDVVDGFSAARSGHEDLSNHNQSPRHANSSPKKTTRSRIVTEFIARARLLAVSGFLQHGRESCAHLGICLSNEPSIARNLIRKAGANDLIGFGQKLE